MEDGRRRELERIMAGLAAGDRAMVVALREAFAEEIGSALVALDRRSRLGVVATLGSARGGRGGAGGDGGWLDQLVLDACFELELVAGAWDPTGGALPWVWAERRLLAVLLRHARIGTRLPLWWGEIDVADARFGGAGGDGVVHPMDHDAVEVLDRLARRSPEAALVRDAVARVVRPADQRLLLVHAEQVAAGDPSPAVTVARLVGRSPAAVRQAVARSRRRLAELAATEPRFAPLRGLPLLGPAAVREAA